MASLLVYAKTAREYEEHCRYMRHLGYIELQQDQVVPCPTLVHPFECFFLRIIETTVDIPGVHTRGGMQFRSVITLKSLVAILEATQGSFEYIRGLRRIHCVCHVLPKPEGAEFSKSCVQDDSDQAFHIRPRNGTKSQSRERVGS